MKQTGKIPIKKIVIGEYKGHAVYVSNRGLGYARCGYYIKKLAKWYKLNTEEILEIKLKW